MSSSLPTLLALLLLLASHGAAHTLSSRLPLLLSESIRIADGLQKEVSCAENVTDIFAGDKTNNKTELLCKASGIVWENQHCHKNLQGLFLNMRQLLNSSNASLKAPCPTAAGNTTPMGKFLKDLHLFFQELAKNETDLIL
ncbi:hypothetical protein CIB84_013318 [Bambusicola thoracicus]|uniref:Interleukin-4 n=1 Tax=Bambusicola thoracicus TaxID=9083 RepID=A0A2P4SFP5_BAMTH|nr:hypothetical protein CIB84_013318 [Bambusicola thoracicus]